MCMNCDIILRMSEEMHTNVVDFFVCTSDVRIVYVVLCDVYQM